MSAMVAFVCWLRTTLIKAIIQKQVPTLLQDSYPSVFKGINRVDKQNNLLEENSIGVTKVQQQH